MIGSASDSSALDSEESSSFMDKNSSSSLTLSSVEEGDMLESNSFEPLIVLETSYDSSESIASSSSRCVSLLSF